MTPFTLKYTAARRRAMHDAHFARGLSYPLIAKLAKDGELVPGDAFEISASYVGEVCRDEAQRRAGKVESALADKPHRDAVEILRRRMISTADLLSNEIEQLARKTPEKVDPERARQITRLVREASALPGPRDPQPVAPGQRDAGVKTGGETRGGVAGALLLAHRGGKTAPDDTNTHDVHREATPEPSANSTAPSTEDDEPGSRSLGEVA